MNQLGRLNLEIVIGLVILWLICPHLAFAFSIITIFLLLVPKTTEEQVHLIFITGLALIFNALTTLL